MALRMVSLRRFFLFHPGLVLALMLVAILVGRGMPEPPQMALNLDRTIELAGWISSAIQKLPHAIYFELQPLSVSQGGAEIHYPYRIGFYVYSSSTPIGEFWDTPLEYGEMLRVRTFLRDPPVYEVPGALDQRQFWFQRNILHTVRLKSPLQIERTGERRGNLFLEPIFWYTRRFENFCQGRVSPDTWRLVRSVFLGRKKVLEESDWQLIRHLGIVHLFVVSGFHVAVVLSFCHLVLRFLGRWAVWFSLGVMWMYVGVTGAGIATIRAALMVTICYLLSFRGLRHGFLNNVGLSACVLLLLWPKAVFNSGFQFSYLSVLALGVIAFPKLASLRAARDGFSAAFSERIWPHRSLHNEKRRKVRYWLEECVQFWPDGIRPVLPVIGAVLCWVLSLAICTLSIQLVTLPLSLYYSNAWSISQVLANLLLIPFFLLFVFGCVLLFGVFWLPGGQWVASVIDLLGLGLSGLSQLLANSGGPWYFPQPQVWQIGLFYLLLGICVVVKRRLRWLGLVAPILLFMSVPSQEDQPGRLTITMLDVGQGESIHVSYPDGSDALVDTGGQRSVRGRSSDFVGKQLVSRYLWGEGIRELRYVLLTHPHADHIQGYQFIRKAFPIGWLLFHEYSDQYVPAEKMDCLRTGDGFVIAGVEHSVLHPELTCSTQPQSDTNNASLVFLLRYGRFSMLFTGDLEAEGERELLSKLTSTTVLKSPHHGSKSSNTASLLQTVGPQAILISAGQDNVFGHPSRATQNRFQKMGIPFFVTSAWGSLRIETDGLDWRLLRYSRRAGGFLEVCRVGGSLVSHKLSSSSPNSGRS